MELLKNYRDLKSRGNVTVTRERGRILSAPQHSGPDGSTALVLAVVPNVGSVIGYEIENQNTGESSYIDSVSGNSVYTIDGILWNNGDIANVYEPMIVWTQKIFDKYTGDVETLELNQDISHLKNTLPDYKTELQSELADVDEVISDISTLLTPPSTGD